MRRALLTLGLVLSLYGCSSRVARAPSAAPTTPGTTLDSKTIALTDVDDEGERTTICAGVWVGAHTILTAGHCVTHFSDKANVASPLLLEVEYATRDEANTPFAQVVRAHPGIVVGLSEQHDLALIRAVGPVPRHGVAQVAEQASAPGEVLQIVGHPGGLTWTHMQGMVAAYRATLSIPDLGTEGPYLQVSAPVWYGNSGGGAFDSEERLVGVCSFIIHKPVNTAFFVPPSEIRTFLVKVGMP